MSLNGKVALVTGAAQGIGEAIAEALLRKGQGAKVCLVDVNDKQGEATAAKFQEEFGAENVQFVKCDVSSPSDWKKTFATVLGVFGCLDIMVNNAGVMDENDPVGMIGVNLTGVILGTTWAVKLMRKDEGGKGGVIVNVASRAGIRPNAFFAPGYTGTKYGVAGFTRAWSLNPHLKEMGLRFACLCPALTGTSILNPMNTLYPMELVKYMLEGLLKMSTVVSGFLQLVEDEECNGAMISVNRQDGIHYFEEPLVRSKM